MQMQMYTKLATLAENLISFFFSCGENARCFEEIYFSLDFFLGRPFM